MPSIDQLPSEKMSGFIAHLRYNGFLVGPAETIDALAYLDLVDPPEARQTRIGLRTILSADKSNWDKFDELFYAYWFDRGVNTAIRMRTTGVNNSPLSQKHPEIWKSILPEPIGQKSASTVHGLGDGEEDADDQGSGRLLASAQNTFGQVDLKDVVSPDNVTEIEMLAEKLAHAIKYRLSRRRKASTRGREISLRRTIRRNASKGGELFDLVYRKRPEKPVNLVVLLDVSGSMQQYSRLFLAFVRGLLGQWLKADAFLFHTRLVCVSDALRDSDQSRALDRLNLMAEGFGGGTKIGECLRVFNANYAKKVLNSRSVVIVMSDGYDTGDVEAMAVQLARLKKRARRVIWLNPLAGWQNYEPVARGMSKAMPYIDLFKPANTLESLAALEPELAQL